MTWWYGPARRVAICYCRCRKFMSIVSGIGLDTTPLNLEAGYMHGVFPYAITKCPCSEGRVHICPRKTPRARIADFALLSGPATFPTCCTSQAAYGICAGTRSSPSLSGTLAMFLVQCPDPAGVRAVHIGPRRRARRVDEVKAGPNTMFRTYPECPATVYRSCCGISRLPVAL
jgi:hypothetical protein